MHRAGLRVKKWEKGRTGGHDKFSWDTRDTEEAAEREMEVILGLLGRHSGNNCKRSNREGRGRRRQGRAGEENHTLAGGRGKENVCLSIPQAEEANVYPNKKSRKSREDYTIAEKEHCLQETCNGDKERGVRVRIYARRRRKRVRRGQRDRERK